MKALLINLTKIKKIIVDFTTQQENLLQGNLTKDIPKDEKPKNKKYKSAWGSPGGERG